MPDVPPVGSSKWRLDAVAITLFLALAGVGACVVTYPPLSGFASPIGPAGETVAHWLVDPIGLGAFIVLAGAVSGIHLYVVRRTVVRMAVRTSGWGLLTVAVAAGADGLTSGPPVSPFGRGGSVGAFLRILLDEQLAAPLPVLVIVILGLIGITIAADGLVRFVLRITAQLALTLLAWAGRGNSLVARLGDRLLGALRRRWVRRPAELVPLEALPSTDIDDVSDPPITRHTDVAAEPIAEVDIPTDDLATDVSDATPVPITRPTIKIQTVSIEQAAEPAAYDLPPLSLLADPDPFPVTDHEQKLRDRATLLEKTFHDFGLLVKVVGIHTGPVITQYEISLDVGLRLNKVTTLSDDLALCLGVSSVRIVAPLPGRNTVGIEVPNDHRQTVRLKELILATTAKAAKFKMPIFVGKDVEGRPLVYDMASMPHLLIAGRTGTGKSVCLNAIILSFLFTRRPDECRMIMIDPKKVELSEYGKVPHLMHPVVTDDKKSEAILAWAVDKMEERYELLRRARVRNIASYNDLGWDEIIRRVAPESEEERQALPRKMPYIVIIVDEVGDLLMSMKKEVESHIIRLAQKSRAAGIHLILATQKPTVDVITGLIKSNLPARICFQVASRADSAVVLDEKGADKLLGMGDMLFLQPGTSTIIRAQGAYVDDREIERVVTALEVHEPNYESELLNLKASASTGGAGGDFAKSLKDRDELYEQAIDVVVREQRGSTSLLQRALGIGYGRASRLIDYMAEDGLVGGFNGSSARDVLVTPEDWDARKAGT